MSERYAVFGATGAQGGPVLDVALRAGLTVRAISRGGQARSAPGPGGHEARCEPIAADLSDPASLVAALAGVRAAFAHLPLPRAADEPPRLLRGLLDAAARAGVGHLVFTTSGPTASRYPSAAPIDANRALVRALLDGPVPAIVLQPSIYLENLRVPLFVPRLLAEGVLDYPPLPIGQAFSWTSQLDQAEVAVAALSRPDLARRVFEVASRGPVTGPELARLLTPWVGRPVRYAPLTPGQFGERVAAAVGAPDMATVLRDLYSALAGMDAVAACIDVEPVERAFGVRLRDARQRIDDWSSTQRTAAG